MKTDGSPFTATDCPGGISVINTPWDTLRPVADSTGYIRKVLDLMPKANYFATGDGLNTAGFRWLLHRHGNPAQGAAVTQGQTTDIDRKQINVKIDQNFTK